MPYNVPLQQTYLALATRKRTAAERKEREARQQRAEADELERKWREFSRKRAAHAQQREVAS